jgi:3'(2'), 5'-bisphosphate nucleotidase
MSDDAAVLDRIEPLALEAGRRIMDVFAAGFRVDAKADASPVTIADRDAEAIILRGLAEAFPTIPCIAEEEACAGRLAIIGDVFFLVDPLDGTREFVNRATDFTVNIALIRNGVPVLGVVYAPALGELYRGAGSEAERALVDGDFRVVERRPIHVRAQAGVPRVVASRSHATPETAAFVSAIQPVELVSVGSSLKFCRIACGEADIYPRFGPTMQWDTAAGDAVLRAAGGCTIDVEGRPLAYGSRGEGIAAFASPWFIATGALTAPLPLPWQGGG